MNDYEDIYTKVPPEKKKMAKSMIDELIFIKDTLDGLKNDVKENGPIEHFVNGKQDFMRESPALKSYNFMVQRYSQLNKQLSDMIPNTPEPSKNNLQEFINE